MNDPYREEREARWRDGLVNYANVFEMLGKRLRVVAKEPNCDQAKKESNEIAELAHSTADLIQKCSVEYPPKRSDT